MFFLLGSVLMLPSGICQRTLLGSKLQHESPFLTDTVVGALILENDVRLTPYHIQGIKPTVFNRAPSVNFLNTLIGKAVGMNVMRAQGGLEAESRIIFRGHRSLNQNNQPLMDLMINCTTRT